MFPINYGMASQGGAFSMSFSEYADGALPASMFGATWTISGGKAINTPTLGSELVINGNMETGDPPANWYTTGIISSVADERTGGAGTQSLHLDSSVWLARIAHQQPGGAVGPWYALSGWGRGVSHPQHIWRIMDSGFNTLSQIAKSSSTWLESVVTGRAIDTSGQIAIATHNVTGATCRADDVSFKPITTATLYAHLDTGLANVTVRANGVTIPEGTQFGVIANLDNAATPANFVIGYYDRGNDRARLDKCVGGVYTNLINATVTYAAGAEISVVNNGTTYQLWYNSAQQGGDQTISDAGIVSNTIHGLFSTGGAGSVDAFFCGITGDETGQALITQGTSINNGGNASLPNITAMHGLLRLHLLDTYPAVFWRELANVARGGSNSWNALGRLPSMVAARAATFVPIDWSNDSNLDHYKNSREAWIRRMWTTLPNCNLVIVIWPIVESDGSIAASGAFHAEYKVLADHYGIPYIDVHTAIKALVDGGEPITTYYNYPADRVHPLDAGHAVAWSLLQPLVDGLAFGSRQFGGALPARLYAGSAEYENAATVYIAGTAYDSKTGTWTEDATGYIQSSEAGATVTYSGTFATIGYERDSGGYPLIDYQIDGGAWVEGIEVGHHGLYIGAPAARTVAFRVRSGTTVRIDRFMAI